MSLSGCLPCLALLAGYGQPKSRMGDCGCGCGGGKKKLSGLGEWGPTPGLTLFPPIQTGRGHAWKQGMASYGSGMGDLNQDGVVSWLTGIIDGSVAQDLLQKRNELYDMRTEAQQLHNDATAMPDSDPNKMQALSAATFAVQYANAGLTSYNEAKAKYDKISNLIQTYSLGAVTPAQLGVLPIVLPIVLTIAGVAVVAVAVNALAGLVDSIKSNGQAARGYIDQAAGFIGAIGGTAVDISNSALKFAGIAALGLVGYFILKSKRMI